MEVNESPIKNRAFYSDAYAALEIESYSRLAMRRVRVWTSALRLRSMPKPLNTVEHEE